MSQSSKGNSPCKWRTRTSLCVHMLKKLGVVYQTSATRLVSACPINPEQASSSHNDLGDWTQTHKDKWRRSLYYGLGNSTIIYIAGIIVHIASHLHHLEIIANVLQPGTKPQNQLSRRAFFDREKCIPSRAPHPHPTPHITPHHTYNTTPKPQRLQRI